MNPPDTTSLSFGLMAATFGIAFCSLFAGRFALRVCRGLPKKTPYLAAYAAILAAVLCGQVGEKGWAGVFLAGAAIIGAAIVAGWVQAVVDDETQNDRLAPTFAVWTSALWAFLLLPMLGNGEPVFVWLTVLLAAFVGAYSTDINEPLPALAGAA